jgi:hypothetical protein
MTITRSAVLGTVAALGLATAASANDFELYGEAEGWNVFIDHDKGTCLIERMDELENVVQMGLTEDRSVGYVGVFTKAETEVKRDQEIPVVVKVGDNLYTGDVTGMRGNITEGYTGGYVLSNDPQFAEDLAKQYEMFVFPSTGNAFVINLQGTLKAMEMGRECNEAQM